MTTATIFTTQTPASVGSDSPVSVGMAFTVDAACSSMRGRYWRPNAANDGRPIAMGLWDGSGTLIASGSHNQTGGDPVGWIWVDWAASASLATGQTYTIAFYDPTGSYPFTGGEANSPIDNPPLHSVVPGGRYTYGASLAQPVTTNTASFYADVEVSTASDSTAAGTSTATGSAVTTLQAISLAVAAGVAAVSIAATGTCTSTGTTAVQADASGGVVASGSAVIQTAACGASVASGSSVPEVVAAGAASATGSAGVAAAATGSASAAGAASIHLAAAGSSAITGTATVVGEQRDIICTGLIDPDRWAGSIDPTHWAGALDPDRYAGTLETG